MSRVIPADKIKEYLQWEKPAVSAIQQKKGSHTNTTITTAKKIGNIQEQAYKEGFEKGQKEGKKSGEAIFIAQTQRLEQIINVLANPLEELDDGLIEQVVELVMVVSRHMIRREINVDSGEVVAVVREGLSQLPIASRNIKVILNPEDMSLVKDAITTSDTDSPINIIEDPVITRGGCRIVTATSQIDATVETRLAAIAAKILGGEREGDTNDR